MGNQQDFKKINKEAAKASCKTAKELGTFRQGKDFKLVDAGAQGALPKVIPSDVIPSFAYGRKSRPSTPIASVVGNHYGVEQEEALNASYEVIYDEMQRKNKQVVQHTGASKARIALARSNRAEAQRQLEEGPKKPWTMSKFDKVQS